MKIVSNKLKCNHCEQIVESTSVHDFRWCKCGRVAVDGGKDYLRRVGKDYTELSDVISEPSDFPFNELPKSDWEFKSERDSAANLKVANYINGRAMFHNLSYVEKELIFKFVSEASGLMKSLLDKGSCYVNDSRNFLLFRIACDSLQYSSEQVAKIQR